MIKREKSFVLRSKPMKLPVRTEGTRHRRPVRFGARLCMTAFCIAVSLSSQSALAGKNDPHSVTASPAPGPSKAARQRIEHLLVARPVYQALKRYDPAALATVVEAVARSPHSGASEPIVLAIARTHLIPIAQRHVARATNRTADEFTRNLVAQLRVVAPQAGDACYALIAPYEDGAIRLAGIDLGTLDDTDLTSLADAIVTSGTTPVPTPDSDEMERRLHHIVSVLRYRFGDDTNLLNRLGEPEVDRAKACQITVSFYAAILRTAEPANVAPLFRYVHAKQSARQPID